MPISVTCLECSATLNAPDAAAGKRVKCPKCRAACLVPAPAAPAFEVVETAPPRRGRAADTDDDRPRRRAAGREEAAARRPVVLWVGLGVGAALLLAAAGGAAYWFGFRGRPGGAAGAVVEVPAADAWETYAAPGNVFKASFPAKPEGKPVALPTGVKLSGEVRTAAVGGKTGVEFYAGYVRFPDDVAPAQVDEAKKWLITLHAAPVTFGTGGQSKRTTKVTADGREWDEDVMNAGPRGKGVVRWHRAGPLLYLVGYRSNVEVAAGDAPDRFLAAYEVLGGDPGDPDPDPVPVRLDGWQEYADPAGAFKVAFPAAPKEMLGGVVTGAAAADFREAVVRDEKTGKARTYFAGYARFPKGVEPRDRGAVWEVTRRAALGDSTSGRRRVSLGGWPWGEERRLELNTNPNLSGTNGVVRVVQAGTAVYAAGIGSTSRYPTGREIDRFFGSFEILGQKPGPTDLGRPPDWAEFKAPGGAFRAVMPASVSVQPPQSAIYKESRLPIVDVAQYIANDPNLTFNVYVVRFKAGTPAAERETAMEHVGRPAISAGPNKLVEATGRKKLTWGGRDAEELTYTPPDRFLARRALTPTAGYLATVTGRVATEPDAALARVFLDGFAFGKE